MTDPFLENCGGWTPAPDILTRNKRYGFEGAYLWGRLRRLCQLGEGKYTISHEALGDRIGMSRRTVIKYLDRLIEDGYVEDLDSGVKNRAHTYSVKMGENKITSGVQISHTEIEIIPQDEGFDTNVGMRILHSDDAEIAHQYEVGMQNLPTTCAEIAYLGVQNLHLNRDSLETSKRDKRESRAREKFLKSHKEFALKLIDLCGYENAQYVTNGKLKECADSIGQLLEWNATIDQLEKYSGYWWGDNPPTFKQVVENWGKFLSWLKHPKSKQQANGSHPPTNKSSPPLNKIRLEELQAESAKEIYDPLKGT